MKLKGLGKALMMLSIIFLVSFRNSYTVHGFDLDFLKNPDLSFFNGETYTVLILGIDGEESEGQRSDSIMIARIDRSAKTLRLVSVPRDSMVEIDGSNDKLAHAYAYGGAEKTREVVEKNLNIKVDAYLCLNFRTFREFIETLEGVNVEMSAEEAEIAIGTYEEGVHNLNGEEALTFARIRALDSDYMRTARQRRLIESIIERLKEKNLDNLPFIAKTFVEIVESDIPFDRIISLGLTLRQDDYTLRTTLIPSEDIGHGEIVDGAWYLVFDKDEAGKLIEGFLNSGNE